MKCQKCGKELQDSIQFCTGCGAKVEPVQMKPRFCTACGYQLEPESLFCTNCGREVTDAEIQYEQMDDSQDYVGKNKKGNIHETFGKEKRSSKFVINRKIMIPVALLLVVVLAGIGVVKLIGTILQNDLQPYYYVQNGELYGIDADGDKKSINKIAENLDWDSDYSHSRLVQYSLDRKYIFYPKNWNEEHGTYDLFCKKIFGKKDSVKIDSNVTKYTVVADNQVIYVKNEDLFISNMDSKTRIARGCDDYVISEDRTQILWSESDEIKKNSKDEDSSLYTWYHALAAVDLEKEKAFICRDAYFSGNDNFFASNEDFSEIYYVDESGNLVELKNFSDSKVIVESESPSLPCNMYNFVVKDGKLIGFVFTRGISADWYDFVEDDCKNQDELISYPSSWYYSSDAAYEQAYKAYEAKENRDDIREGIDDGDYPSYEEVYYIEFGYTPELKGMTLGLVRDVVHYWGDNDNIVAVNNVNSGLGVMVFSQEKLKEFEKIKLSQIGSRKELVNEVYREMAQISSFIVENGGDWYTLDGSYFETYFIQDIVAMEDAIYLSCGEIQSLSDEYTYSLWKCKKKEGVLDKPEVVDEDVEAYRFCDINGKLGYFKNFEGDFGIGGGDFYLDGELIDYDVNSIHDNVIESDSFFYCSYTEDEYADLYYCEKGDKRLLVEEVKTYRVLSPTKALILDGSDTLYCFNADAKEEVIQIATGIDEIFLAENVQD